MKFKYFSLVEKYIVPSIPAQIHPTIGTNLAAAPPNTAVLIDLPKVLVVKFLIAGDLYGNAILKTVDAIEVPFVAVPPKENGFIIV